MIRTRRSSRTGFALPAFVTKAAAGAVCALLGAFAIAPDASATFVTMSSAGDYAVVTGTGDQFRIQNSGTNITGDVAVGGTTSIASGNKITGELDKSSGVSVSNSGTITGGIVTASLAQVIADANQAASTAAGETANLTGYGSAISLSTGQSLVIKAVTNLSDNVINISALSLNNATLTFDDNGYSGAKFVVNVTGNFTVTGSSGKYSVINGVNGASAADVPFNIEGTSKTVSITNSGTAANAMIGTILAPQSSVTLGGTSLTGAIIAGVSNLGSSYTVTVNDGADINFVPRSPPHRVPEPGTLALFATALVALGIVRRRKIAA